jgi:hypothetical protein
MRILEEYVSPTRLAVIDIRTCPCEGVWTTFITVKGKEKDYVALHDELQRCWLLEEELA